MLADLLSTKQVNYSTSDGLTNPRYLDLRTDGKILYGSKADEWMTKSVQSEN